MLDVVFKAERSKQPDHPKARELANSFLTMLLKESKHISDFIELMSPVNRKLRDVRLLLEDTIADVKRTNPSDNTAQVFFQMLLDELDSADGSELYWTSLLGNITELFYHEAMHYRYDSVLLKAIKREHYVTVADKESQEAVSCTKPVDVGCWHTTTGTGEFLEAKKTFETLSGKDAKNKVQALINFRIELDRKFPDNGIEVVMGTLADIADPDLYINILLDVSEDGFIPIKLVVAQTVNTWVYAA